MVYPQNHIPRNNSHIAFPCTGMRSYYQECVFPVADWIQHIQDQVRKRGKERG